jgi:hypothetical protein
LIVRVDGHHPPERACAGDALDRPGQKEKTCIDCHKGIAHQLPLIPPGEAPTDTIASRPVLRKAEHEPGPVIEDLHDQSTGLVPKRLVK